MAFGLDFFTCREEISLENFRGRPGNILVISPHPDDDVLGAGGMMIEASQRGRGVFSAYITDGGGSPRREPGMSSQEMARRREGEAQASLKIIGAIGGFFLRMKSDEIQRKKTQELKNRLKEIFELLSPAEIYLPAPYERHLTHQRSTLITLEVLRSMPDLRTLLRGYSLWGSCWGGKRRHIQDISAMMKKKIEAIRVHETQLGYKNYCQGISGRNISDAVFWESHEVQETTFMEIFLDMTELIEKKELSLEDFIRQDVELFIQTFLAS